MILVRQKYCNISLAFELNAPIKLFLALRKIGEKPSLMFV